MTLFRLDASIRVEGSHSRQIADIVEAEWQVVHPTGTVVRRDVGMHPLPVEAWAQAAIAGHTPGVEPTPEQLDARSLAARLTDELVEADALLFAVPLYNFGVPAPLKTWVDLVIADPRMGPGAEPVTAGKPAVLIVVRGGGYGPGTPRDGWDHSTGWIRRILADVWLTDLQVVESEFTLADVSPALAQFKDLAAQLRSNAEDLARSQGRTLAGATA
jgi:FMN-dependent NADH-azoreductase